MKKSLEHRLQLQIQGFGVGFGGSRGAFFVTQTEWAELLCIQDTSSVRLFVYLSDSHVVCYVSDATHPQSHRSCPGLSGVTTLNNLRREGLLTCFERSLWVQPLTAGFRIP